MSGTLSGTGIRAAWWERRGSVCFKRGHVKHGLLASQGRIVAGLDVREVRRWRQSDARLSSVATCGLSASGTKASRPLSRGGWESPGWSRPEGETHFSGRQPEALDDDISGLSLAYVVEALANECVIFIIETTGEGAVCQRAIPRRIDSLREMREGRPAFGGT
ncbi:hypothetical protein VUR80DRAFT_5028 [Thermomyces stellatus]